MIDLDKISIFYGEKEVCKDVSFTIRKGRQNRFKREEWFWKIYYIKAHIRRRAEIYREFL